MKSHIKRAFGKCICSLMLVITLLVSMAPVSAQSQVFEITGEMQTYGSAGSSESFVSTEQALEYKTSTQILSQGDIEYYCRTALGKLPNGRGLQYAYDQIVEGLEQGKEVINLTDGTFKISQSEFYIVLEAHRRDYAHHFWLDPYYNIRGTSASNITQFLPQYMFEGDELTEAKALFEQKVQQVLSGITPTMSDFEKELYLHDTLADMVVYVEDTNAHNAYGALVEGRAV